MNKEVKKLFLLTSFVAITDGLFYNLLELWTKSNNMSIETTSRVLSLSALITVSVIFLCTNIIKTKHLKKFALVLLLIRFIILLGLIFLYQSGYNMPIKLLIMFDYATSVEIYLTLYPLIAMYDKDDKVFAKKKLVYEIAYYSAAFLTGLLIGKVLLNYTISYNTYTLIASIFSLLGFILLYNTEVPISNKLDKDNLLFSIASKIKKDKTSLLYLSYIITNDISFYALSGMLITISTHNLGLSAGVASNIKLGFAIAAVGIGTLILYKLTLKNNYINISIKLVGRIICYILPVVYFCNTTVIIGLIYTVLTSSAYVHVTDAPYVNRFNNEEQLAFANLTEMIGYASRALGTFICGLGIVYGLRYNFIIALIFTSLAYILAILACRSLKKKRGN